MKGTSKWEQRWITGGQRVGYITSGTRRRKDEEEDVIISSSIKIRCGFEKFGVFL